MEGILLNTISKNKEGFSKRKIDIAFKYWELQKTLRFPTVKEVKWIIRSNQIQDCQVETEDVDNVKLFSEKCMPYLKGKTNRENLIRVTEDLISVPNEFIKVNKYIYSLLWIYFP